MKKFVQNPQIFIDAANELGCRVEALLAVIAVETPNPHIGDTSYGPIILNERHKFYKYLPQSKRNDPRLTNEIYSSKPGGYSTGRNSNERQRKEHEKLRLKYSIDSTAALMSISMGLFQIMGFNYKLLGYNTVSEMWKDAKKKDDRIDLMWFVKFCKANGLDKWLRQLRFDKFAAGYNGPNYKINKYDEKMMEYYRVFCRTSPLAPLKDDDDVVKVNEKKEAIVVDTMIKLPNIEILIPVQPLVPTYTGFPVLAFQMEETVVEG